MIIISGGLLYVSEIEYNPVFYSMICILFISASIVFCRNNILYIYIGYESAHYFVIVCRIYLQNTQNISPSSLLPLPLLATGHQITISILSFLSQHTHIIE